jgi:glycosyltransferase involved in cell wall biosynthesis
MRGSTPLKAVYRCLPVRARSAVSRLINARLIARTRFVHTAEWDRAFVEPLPLTPGTTMSKDIGINIFGYLRGQFGLGESARLYSRALMSAGVPVALCDIDLDLPHDWHDASLDAFIGDDAPFSVSVIFVNPDYLQQALEKIGRSRIQRHHLIACWFWELGRIPSEWLPAIDQVDEILAGSHFIEDAFRKVTGKPVLRVPLPLGPLHESGLQRRDFGLDENKFIFLSTFDFNSWIARKNPFAVIQAFVAAFPADRDDVRLLIKSSNGFRYPEKLRELIAIADRDPRVIVRDEVIDRAHVNALHRCCDAYVSLHRAEGFGLGLAEAMALGKPVIATGWSGNLEFMNSDVACMVDFKLVPVNEGEYPHAAGAVWADPSISDAASAMRKLADDPLEAEKLGVKGRDYVRNKLAPEASAEVIVRRLKELAAARAGEAMH